MKTTWKIPRLYLERFSHSFYPDMYICQLWLVCSLYKNFALHWLKREIFLEWTDYITFWQSTRSQMNAFPMWFLLKIHIAPVLNVDVFLLKESDEHSHQWHRPKHGCLDQPGHNRKFKDKLVTSNLDPRENLKQITRWSGTENDHSKEKDLMWHYSLSETKIWQLLMNGIQIWTPSLQKNVSVSRVEILIKLLGLHIFGFSLVLRKSYFSLFLSSIAQCAVTHLQRNPRQFQTWTLRWWRSTMDQ